MTTIAPLREDDIVAALRAIVEARTPTKIRLGIGDDAAVWQPSRSHQSVITTDVLIEDVHFTLATMTMREIGWRAMAANASDIAAMGARGVLATVALGLPPSISMDALLELYRGLEACARRCGIAIVGGDLSRSPVLSLAIAAVGEVRPSNLKTRSGGRAGDVLAVTGPLGASRAGLDLLSGRIALPDEVREQALRAHRTPDARMEEGRWLAASTHVHAMMDCSDGLSTDSARLAAASGLGACIEAVPVAAAARAAAEHLALDPDDYALAGGEDFELIVAIAPRAYPHLAKRFQARFGRALHAVGQLRADAGLVVRKNGREEPLARTGWDHFV